jgi:hypothetical protein
VLSVQPLVEEVLRQNLSMIVTMTDAEIFDKISAELRSFILEGIKNNETLFIDMNESAVSVHVEWIDYALRKDVALKELFRILRECPLDQHFDFNLVYEEYEKVKSLK